MTTTTSEKPMSDNTEENTKAILTSVASALWEISESLGVLSYNIEALNEKLDSPTPGLVIVCVPPKPKPSVPV
jgi:hypothetical protein